MVEFHESRRRSSRDCECLRCVNADVIGDTPPVGGLTAHMRTSRCLTTKQEALLGLVFDLCLRPRFLEPGEFEYRLLYPYISRIPVVR